MGFLTTPGFKRVNNATLQLVAEELAATIVGHRIGRVFQLSKLSFVIDIRGCEPFLLIAADTSGPRLHLIRRKLRDVEKQSIQQLAFAQFLRKRISGAVINSVSKLESERIVEIGLTGETELGDKSDYTIVVQLTGRSSNLFLLDADRRILDRLRDTHGDGQEIATLYAPPARAANGGQPSDKAAFHAESGSISEALDAHYIAAAADSAFSQLAAAARAKFRQAVARNARLGGKLRADLANHGDPSVWKRYGDLILANIADAPRLEGKVLVVDYFDENTPVIEIDIDDNDELTFAAEKFFRRYTKARNAGDELNRRLVEISSEAATLAALENEIETAVGTRDERFLNDYLGRRSEPQSGGSKGKRSESADPPPGTRRFVSTDGFEILVGKGAKDNDQLTFRIARSSDLWLHAADYPGSHVIVKNPNRVEIPPATVIEAAKLAAFYSNARQHPKAAVHYTVRKNVHKPRGGVAGLVSLTSFKTILVEPGVPDAT